MLKKYRGLVDFKTILAKLARYAIKSQMVTIRRLHEVFAHLISILNTDLLKCL